MVANSQCFAVGLLWRAIYHCDRIADLAANGPHEAAGAPPPERWDLITTGAWRLPEEDFPEEIRGRDPCTNFEARPAQIAYIRALPAQDVLFIFYLVAVCGAAFSRKRRIYESSDPAAVSLSLSLSYPSLPITRSTYYYHYP